MKKIGKMNISQIIFASAFYAIITTIFEDYFHNRSIFGLFGGLVILLGFMLAKLIVRNDN